MLAQYLTVPTRELPQFIGWMAHRYISIFILANVRYHVQSGRLFLFFRYFSYQEILLPILVPRVERFHPFELSLTRISLSYAR